MPRYEYKVVPAPNRGVKAKGIKGPEGRFSHGLEELMNGLAADGWEYQRAETLPSVERAGLTGTTTEWRNVLVFRRPSENDAEASEPALLPAPVLTVAPDTVDPDVPTEQATEETPNKDHPNNAEPSGDNGVDNTRNTQDDGAPPSGSISVQNQ